MFFVSEFLARTQRITSFGENFGRKLVNFIDNEYSTFVVVHRNFVSNTSQKPGKKNC